MKTFLKRFLLLIPFQIFILSFAMEAVARPKLQIFISTKYKGEDCYDEGGWCFKLNIWGERIIVPGDGERPPGSRSAEIQVSDDGRTAIVRFTDSGQQLPFRQFYADTDFELPPELSNELGFESVVLLKGVYKVDYNSSRSGALTFNISTR